MFDDKLVHQDELTITNARKKGPAYFLDTNLGEVRCYPSVFKELGLAKQWKGPLTVYYNAGKVYVAFPHLQEGRDDPEVTANDPMDNVNGHWHYDPCLLYTSPSPRDS